MGRPAACARRLTGRRSLRSVDWDNIGKKNRMEVTALAQDPAMEDGVQA